MDSEPQPHSSGTGEGSGSLTIGNVQGGIHGSTLAGRDVIQTITNVFSGPGEVRDRRNQLILLQKVKSFWVEGVLEKSAHSVALIDLGKEGQAEAVERPWEMVLETPGATSRTLPRGKKIVDAFDEMGRALLILGEPGSGKTITLLELARDAIARAEKDPTQPIPVVFVLSSWAEKKPRLTEWLIEELNIKYQIPQKVGRTWAENNDLLLLLDGLDEVAAGQRAACVEAINTFRQESGLTALAICSRSEEYQALETRLKLQGAIRLQPLTAPQIQDYLAAAGGSLTSLRTAMQHDAALQELAQSPLMLSVMSLAYQGLPDEALQGGEIQSIESRRNHLFATYVDRMFKRRKAGQRYTFEQSLRWLTWLARRMVQHNQTVFLLEQLQPSWLSSRGQLWAYALGSRLIGAGGIACAVLCFLLGIGRMEANSADPAALLFLWLPFLVGCLGAGLMMGLVGGRRLIKRGQETAAGGGKPQLVRSVLRMLATSLIATLGFVLAIVGLGLVPLLGAYFAVAALGLSMVGCGWGTALGAMLFFGFGLIFGWRRGGTSAGMGIQTVESLAWSWKRFLMPVLASVLISGATWIVTSRTREPGAKLWDPQGNLIARLDGHTAAVVWAGFNRDGTRLITVSDNDTAWLWDGRDGTLIAPISKGNWYAPSSIFSPDGTRILTGGPVQAAAWLWDAENGRLIQQIAAGAIAHGPDFSSDGTRIAATVDGAPRLWDARDGQPIVRSPLPDEEREQVARSEGGKPPAILEEGPAWIFRFSPDRKRIATVSRDGKVRLWNAGDRRRIAEFAVAGVPSGLLHRNASAVETYPLFNPDGTRLVTVSEDGTAQLWDGTNGRFIRTLEGLLDTGLDSFMDTFDAFFSPDGTRLVTVSLDGVARLWDGKDGKLVAMIEGVGDPKDANPLEFSPDGTKIVTLSAGAPMDRRPQSALWLVPGLLIGLFAGLRAGVRDAKTFPNQGVWLSLRNAVLAGLIGGLILALISALILVLFKRPLATNVFLLAGLFASFGVLAALWYGGLDVLQHFILRLILSVKKQIPWSYSRFLDHAAERILLRKVGGGYIFIHRLLLEYLAACESSRSPEDPTANPWADRRSHRVTG